MVKAAKKTTKKTVPKAKAKAKPKVKSLKSGLVAGKPGRAKKQPALPVTPVLPPPPLAVGASPAVLERLWAVVSSRRDADPMVSHSARLLSRGTAKIAQKFGEEAVECLIEATLGNHRALVAESADVLYHLIVLWVDGGVEPAEVWAELQRREGVSGIAEKAARARTLPLSLGLATTKIP
jgi:phosphoribosyl-ATP pyrophosphohydrolase